MNVIVYGTLRKGLDNHYRLRTKAEDIVIKDVVAGYKLLNLGRYPTIVATENLSDRVVVEIYNVSARVLEDLDYLEGYPTHYDRKLVRTESGNTGLMYLLAKKSECKYPNVKPVPGGDWAVYAKENKGRY